MPGPMTWLSRRNLEALSHRAWCIRDCRLRPIPHVGYGTRIQRRQHIHIGYKAIYLRHYEMVASTTILAHYAVNVRPVFLNGADADSRHGEQLLGC